MNIESCFENKKIHEIKLLDDELKEFFDNLFRIYASPWENMSEIQECLQKVKKYILENTPPDTIGEVPSVFGFTDEAQKSIALLRVKAYIVYTQFCNLGQHLAKVYDKADFLSDRKEDFNLSMKYFMFCDNEICQCVHTGLRYTFNMDFLPGKKNVYRLCNGEEKNTGRFELYNNNFNYFAQITETIRKHINGELSLLSFGKKFFHCLMKYYHQDNKNTLHIYKDMAVNYVELKNELGENLKMSVPAFLQKYCYMKKEMSDNKLDFVIDISVFRNGRGVPDSSDTTTLAGFIHKVCNNKIKAQVVGSISDGEIVSTKSPEPNAAYKLDINEALGLVHLLKERVKGIIPKCSKISKITIWTANGKENPDINKICELESKIYESEGKETVSGSEITESSVSYHNDTNNLPVYEEYCKKIDIEWSIEDV